MPLNEQQGPKEEEVERFTIEGWAVYGEEDSPFEPWAIFGTKAAAEEYIALLVKSGEYGDRPRLRPHPISARCAMHNHFAAEDYRRPTP